MIFLINASNLKSGGGLQVADSIIRQLPQYDWHQFIVVLPQNLEYLKADLVQSKNCVCVSYNLPHTFLGITLGRNQFLDDIVEKYNVDAVFTIFGPSLWRPKVKHICGFARSQLIYTDSPFFQNLSLLNRIKSYFREKIKLYNFDITSDCLVTESDDVSFRLKNLLPLKCIYTITNSYNQIFKCPEMWTPLYLEPFDGLTMLTISANYPHKNLGIIPQILDYIDANNIQLKIRFVVTLSEIDFYVDEKFSSRILRIGKIANSVCPPLLQQCDFMFLPTLLECFSASYPEAMYMNKPIITSDLPFARSLCGDAALYVDSLSPKSIVESLLHVTEDTISALVENGKKQLDKYDTAETRCKKIVELLEKIDKS